MESLDWRLHKLEIKLAGQVPTSSYTYRQDSDNKPIIDQLNEVATNYRHFVQNYEPEYLKFAENYKKIKPMLEESHRIGVSAKVDRVLHYERELTNHMEKLSHMVEKADKVLDIERWPDLSRIEDKIISIERTMVAQREAATTIDTRFEDLIGIHNDINASFKASQVGWFQKLEALENDAERKSDDDL